MYLYFDVYMLKVSLVPRLFQWGERKEPGTHCMQMRDITTEYHGDTILFQYVGILMMSHQSSKVVVGIGRHLIVVFIVHV